MYYFVDIVWSTSIHNIQQNMVIFWEYMNLTNMLVCTIKLKTCKDKYTMVMHLIYSYEFILNYFLKLPMPCNVYDW